jgi:hypothetical protein
MHPYPSRVFKQYQEHNKRCHGVGDINTSDKQTNNLPSEIKTMR